MKAEPNNRELNAPTAARQPQHTLDPLSAWVVVQGSVGGRSGHSLCYRKLVKIDKTMTKLLILRAQCMNESEKR